MENNGGKAFVQDLVHSAKTLHLDTLIQIENVGIRSKIPITINQVADRGVQCHPDFLICITADVREGLK